MLVLMLDLVLTDAAALNAFTWIQIQPSCILGLTAQSATPMSYFVPSQQPDRETVLQKPCLKNKIHVHPYLLHSSVGVDTVQGLSHHHNIML